MESMIIRISRLISLIGLGGLLFLAGITVLEVILRTYLNFPIIGVSDVSRLAITLVIGSCLPIVTAEKRHITVRIVGNTLGTRANNLLDSFGGLITIIIFGLMAWQLWIYSNQLAASKETTMILLLPVAPWWKITAVLIAICVPNQLINLILSFKKADSAAQVTPQQQEH